VAIKGSVKKKSEHLHYSFIVLARLVRVVQTADVDLDART
jgi:hypothetical protein